MCVLLGDCLPGRIAGSDARRAFAVMTVDRAGM
jgi:hypothetical protein